MVAECSVTPSVIPATSPYPTIRADSPFLAYATLDGAGLRSSNRNGFVIAPGAGETQM